MTIEKTLLSSSVVFALSVAVACSSSGDEENEPGEPAAVDASAGIDAGPPPRPPCTVNVELATLPPFLAMNDHASLCTDAQLTAFAAGCGPDGNDTACAGFLDDP